MNSSRIADMTPEMKDRLKSYRLVDCDSVRGFEETTQKHKEWVYNGVLFELIAIEENTIIYASPDLVYKSDHCKSHIRFVVEVTEEDGCVIHVHY